MFNIFFFGINHLHQSHLFLFASTRLPTFVSPTMVGPAETEGEVRFATGKDFIERTLKELLAIAEPIMPIAKSLNARFTCKLCLLLAHLWQTQIIEPQICGDTRLVMPVEQRFCLCYVRPFGEALAPPFIVLGNGMELRKIECYDSGFWFFRFTIHHLTSSCAFQNAFISGIHTFFSV